MIMESAKMEKIMLTYQLSPGSFQLLSGYIVTADRLAELQKEVELEYRGEKADWDTCKTYKIFQDTKTTRNSDGSWKFGNYYFIAN